MNVSIKKFCSMIEPQKSKYFDIPTIQRGFVWKPYQIENLWDSLARNFPIGTFTVDDSSNNIQILDGQQRASAIAIGYNIQSFNLNSDFRRLFVDIAQPGQETDRKFTFRLITRSHPWGYQLKDNEKTLTDADRRDALEVFEKNDIIKNDVKYYNVEEKGRFFPYDCFLPVPVEFFLKGDMKRAKDWIISSFGNFITIEDNKIKMRHLDDHEKGDKFPTKGLLKLYGDISKEKPLHLYTIGELYKEIQNINSYQLLFSNLTNSKLKLTDDIIESDNELVLNEEVRNEEEKTDDIEIIFQRLNRGGTPISEDDLIFSLFKSSFGNTDEDTNMLNNFTENCRKVISPSRLFRLAYLLWKQEERYNNNKTKNYELVNQRIDYKLAKKDFNKPEFKEFLKCHFLETSQDNDNYFKKFIENFLYDNKKMNRAYPILFLFNFVNLPPN